MANICIAVLMVCLTISIICNALMLREQKNLLKLLRQYREYSRPNEMGALDFVERLQNYLRRQDLQLVVTCGWWYFTHKGAVCSIAMGNAQLSEFFNAKTSTTDSKLN